MPGSERFTTSRPKTQNTVIRSTFGTDNKSFDIFGTPPSAIKKENPLKHKRIENLILAHLNHLIDTETEENENFFPILLKRFEKTWNFDIQSLYSASENEQRAGLEAFAMKRIFTFLQKSAIQCSSEERVNLELASCHTVLNMFYNGMSFDIATCNSFIKTHQMQIERLEEEIWRLAHGKFNIDSSHEVSHVLFNRLGLVYPETSNCKSKQRHLPTNKAILERMTEQNVIVGKIIDYRHKQHTLSQCLIPLAKYETRIIHCWFEMCTNTGRILTIRPNLQNVPKKVSPDGMSARKLFTASPGSVIIGADYKQLELRVLAHLSNDSNLVSLIAQERDLFQELSADWNFPRDAVKQLCYGLIYGMGAKSLAELTKMKVEEAESMFKAFFALFPELEPT
uniref:DNA-directed DNA polymerase n=1 Tax=Caenorhabditis japonica TaxID=281687 RepID=A0A8R1DEP8_CAEJA